MARAYERGYAHPSPQPLAVQLRGLQVVLDAQLQSSQAQSLALETGGPSDGQSWQGKGGERGQTRTQTQERKREVKLELRPRRERKGGGGGGGGSDSNSDPGRKGEGGVRCRCRIETSVSGSVLMKIQRTRLYSLNNKDIYLASFPDHVY